MRVALLWHATSRVLARVWNSCRVAACKSCEAPRWKKPNPADESKNSRGYAPEGTPGKSSATAGWKKGRPCKGESPRLQWALMLGLGSAAPTKRLRRQAPRSVVG